MRFIGQNKRNTEEFTLLFEQQLNSLYSLALRMTRNQHNAEDLIQDTAMKAFRYFHRFDHGTNFRAWIFRILTNNYINIYRKTKKAPVSVEIGTVSFKLSDSPNGYWSDLDDRNHHFDYREIFDDEINNAIEKLPEEYRMVVLLADVEGMSYKEISEIIEHPLGTVMSRLHRGRKALQRLLSTYAREKGYVSD